MKFAAVVILYNPSEENIQHIKVYAESFDVVFVFDNSEPNFKKNYSFNKVNKKFVYLSQNENIGLSAAFNIILKHEKIKDFDYLCTLDQDSVFSCEDILCFQRYIKDNSSSLIDTTGIIAPFIDYGIGEKKPDVEYDEKDWVITSGSFINLSLIKKHNILFDENYFIDKVDADFCKQVKNKGLSIKLYYNSVLYQSLGDFTGYRHTNHSPLRHYYLFRNRLYFNHKYYGLIKCWLLNVLQSLRHAALIAIYEKHPYKKIRIFFKALRDYLHNKMGKSML